MIRALDHGGWGSDPVHPRSVTPDSFRGPLRGEENGLRRERAFAARWTPEQVRGDGEGEANDRPKPAEGKRHDR
jgi:hypothetical protein